MSSSIARSNRHGRTSRRVGGGLGKTRRFGQRRPDLVGGGFYGRSVLSPFYYVLEVPAYLMGKGSDVFTRLELMRLTSL